MFLIFDLLFSMKFPTNDMIPQSAQASHTSLLINEYAIPVSESTTYIPRMNSAIWNRYLVLWLVTLEEPHLVQNRTKCEWTNFGSV